MRVGILTFPGSVSFGAVLQMDALYTVVNKLGHEAEIINYHNSFMKAEKHVIKEGSTSSFISKRKKQIKYLMHHKMYKTFKKFEKANFICYPKKSFSSIDVLRETGKRYGAVICGSDQVWNPDITGSDMSYFLDFCDDTTKRISYAPSFGIEEFSDDFSARVEKELNQFHAISVREAPGKVFVDKITGLDVPLVVDPTLLLDSKDWQSVEKKCTPVNGEYILYYTIRSSDTLFKHCKELSQKTGLKILVVGGNFLTKIKNKDKNIVYVPDIGPAQWLFLMRNARYIVTNSFHGTAFSINYKKDFYVEFSSFTNSRLSHIVSTLGFESRVLGAEPLSDIIPCDYTCSDRVLPELKKSSMDFLIKALEN